MDLEVKLGDATTDEWVGVNIVRFKVCFDELFLLLILNYEDWLRLSLTG